MGDPVATINIHLGFVATVLLFVMGFYLTSISVLLNKFSVQTARHTWPVFVCAALSIVLAFVALAMSLESL